LLIFRLASWEAPARADRMKIATFDINNVNKRLPNLIAWPPPCWFRH
jgi:hypothetical protein